MNRGSTIERTTILSFLSAVTFVMLNYNASAQHFLVVHAGNPYTPMNIIVNSAYLDGGGLLQSGDEIAVFDVNDSGLEICVGQVSITNEFSPDTNYTIIATADDPTTPDIQDGFIVGHEIIFRYWDSDENTEIILISKTFDSTLDTTYQSFGTALVELEGFSYETWTGESDTAWNNVLNWNFNRVPSLSFDVLIPTSPSGSRFPSISILDAKCRNITLDTNAIIKIHGKLTVGSSGGTPIYLFTF